MKKAREGGPILFEAAERLLCRAGKAEARIKDLETALIAARQFLWPEVARGPGVNGWQNTVDCVSRELALIRERKTEGEP